jgi:hypothetical protein
LTELRWAKTFQVYACHLLDPTKRKLKGIPMTVSGRRLQLHSGFRVKSFSGYDVLKTVAHTPELCDWAVLLSEVVLYASGVDSQNCNQYKGLAVFEMERHKAAARRGTKPECTSSRRPR